MKRFPRTTAYCILLVFGLVLSACGRNTSDSQEIPENALKVYRTDNAYSSLFAEYYVPESNGGLELADELLRQLSSSPEQSTYKSVIPEGIILNDMHFGEAKQLILDFSSEYNSLSKVEEIICRAAIVKTLCQIDVVDHIEFYVNGNPLMLSNDQPAGIMKSADFIDNTGDNTEFTQSVSLTIYLTDAEGKTLKESSLIVESDGSRSMEEMVLTQLINGPLQVQTELRAVIPEGTKLNKVSSKDGICYVDFSPEFLNKLPGISRDVAIYSVVNSLCELPSVLMVQFSIEGEAIKNYDGEPFNAYYERKLELIEGEMAGVTSE